MRIISRSSTTAPPTPVVSGESQWQSPVPYLYGGLAAMLGLIAFTLLLLVCSYRKLSSVRSEETDLDEDKFENSVQQKQQQEMEVYEDRILVIMAGDQKPTFLATTVIPKILNSSNVSSGKLHNHVEIEMDANFDKIKQMGHQENDQDL